MAKRIKVITLLALGTLGAIGARAAFARRKKATGRVANPFSNASCTRLKDKAEVNRWIDTVAFRRYQEAYAKSPVTTSDPRDLQRILVFGYVDHAMRQLPAACEDMTAEPARQNLYHAVWCKVTADLVGRGRIDPALEDFSQWCDDPQNNPLKQEAP